MSISPVSSPSPTVPATAPATTPTKADSKAYIKTWAVVYGHTGKNSRPEETYSPGIEKGIMEGKGIGLGIKPLPIVIVLIPIIDFGVLSEAAVTVVLHITVVNCGIL
jgi:hypothetical protein